MPPNHETSVKFFITPLTPYQEWCVCVLCIWIFYNMNGNQIRFIFYSERFIFYVFVKKASKKLFFLFVFWISGSALWLCLINVSPLQYLYGSVSSSKRKLNLFSNQFSHNLLSTLKSSRSVLKRSTRVCVCAAHNVCLSLLWCLCVAQ